MVAKYFRIPFGTSGDTTAVPDTVQSDGSVSYPQAFGPYYEVGPPFNATSLPMPRRSTNQLFFDVTTALQQYQQHGVPDFITSSMNGGSPYSYSKYDRVRYDPGSGPQVYVSKVNTNTDLPTVTASWNPTSLETFSLATNGYFKNSIGLIQQWGIVNSVANSATWSVTFPITFPTALVYVNYSGNTNDAPSADSNPIIPTRSTSGFSSTNNFGATNNFNWFALGY